MWESFFQSQIRRDLQSVFGREIMWWKRQKGTYRWVIRSKSMGPLLFSWKQILWYTFESDASSLDAVLQHYPQTSWGDSFLQLWCDDVLSSGDVLAYKSEKAIDQMILLRTQKESDLLKNNLVKSWRENMPLATIVTPCLEWDTLKTLMHSWHRRYLKKAYKADLRFEEARQEDRELFYAVWQDLASDKWLGIMSRQHFLWMMSYLSDQWAWQLFLAKKGEAIVSGSVCAFFERNNEKQIIYLYGATARAFGNVWWHIFLQHEIMKWWHKNDYDSFDHRWVAPVWFSHHLWWVSRFKERFGWKRIEYVGNYDYVHNNLLYNVMKRLKKH